MADATITLGLELDKNTQRNLSKLGDGLKKVAATTAVAFAGLGTGIALAVREASKVEDLTTRFRVLTGSVEEANFLIRDLQEFSARTPFQLEGLAEASATLIGFGTASDEVLPRIRAIGDVAAAVNVPIQDLSLIFGQVQAAGKLTGERFLQLAERGVVLTDSLAETLGTTSSNISKLISQGKVDFATFEKAFNSLSEEGGIAFNGLDIASGTLSGKLSTLGDNFSLLLADIGKEFLPAVKDGVDGLIVFLQTLRSDQDFKIFIQNLGDVAGFLSESIPSAIKATLTGINFLGSALAAIAVVISSGFTKSFTEALDDIQEANAQVLQQNAETQAALTKQEEEGAKKRSDNQKAAAQIRQELAEQETQQRLDNALIRFELEQEQQQEFKEILAGQEQAEKDAFIASLEKDFQDEKAIRQKAFQDQFKQDQKEKAAFLENQRQFGKVFAEINAVINSQEIQGRKKALGDLSALTQSENSKLKAIGKSASVAQIAIKTAEGATSAYAALAGIPFVGPALGLAAASSLIAFGVEQTRAVLSAADGGVVPGAPTVPRGAAGTDSVPSLLSPGELVVPRQNFEEVINALTTQRSQQTDDEGAQQTATSTQVMIGFNGSEASQVLTARQNEDRSLGISREQF